MRPPRLIEERNGQLGDLPGVVSGVLTALGEFDDAATPDVRILLNLADLSSVPMDVVEHEALAQCHVAQGVLLRTEPAENRVKQDAAGYCEIRATRVEPLDPLAYDWPANLRRAARAIAGALPE